MPVTWPNLITVLRILMIPLFVLAAMQVRPVALFFRVATLVVFAMVVLMDGLDGFLARRLNQRSRLGAFLDPLGDKLLMISAYILLAMMLWPEPRMPRWVSTVVISRDVLIALGFLTLFVVTGKLKIIQPSGIGKLCTGIQALAIIVVIVAPWLVDVVGGGTGHLIMTGLFLLTVFMTLLTGVDYLYASRVCLGEDQHLLLADHNPPGKE